MIPLAIAGIELAAKFAPDIIGLFSKDKKESAEKVGSTILSVAKSLTGEDSEDAAVKALSADPALALKFKEAVMADKHVAEQMRLADIQSARTMYTETDHTTADRIADSVFKYNLWLVFLLVAANVGVMFFITQPVIASSLSTVIGASLTYLWQERRSILEFYFGSSQGSKDKTKQLIK